MICNAKQLAGFKTVHIFNERYFQTDMKPFPANISFMDKPVSWLFHTSNIGALAGLKTVKF